MSVKTKNLLKNEVDDLSEFGSKNSAHVRHEVKDVIDSALWQRVKEDSASVQVGYLENQRDTPTAGDEAYLSYRLKDGAGNPEEAVRFAWSLPTITDGAEDSRLSLSTLNGGTLTEALVLQEDQDVKFSNGRPEFTQISTADPRADTTADEWIHVVTPNGTRYVQAYA